MKKKQQSKASLVSINRARKALHRFSRLPAKAMLARNKLIFLQDQMRAIDSDKCYPYSQSRLAALEREAQCIWASLRTEIRNAHATVNYFSAISKDLSPAGEQGSINLNDQQVSNVSLVFATIGLSKDDVQISLTALNNPNRLDSAKAYFEKLAQRANSASHLDSYISISSGIVKEVVAKCSNCDGPVAGISVAQEDPSDGGEDEGDGFWGIVAEIGKWVIENWDKIKKFFEDITDIFNETDDDEARQRIFSLTCSQIASLSFEEVSSMLEAMLDGPTGVDDERAIIRLIQCLPCNMVEDEVWPNYGNRILSDVDGDEFDLLVEALQRCGNLRFSALDDDQTRSFISENQCDVLRRLSISDIRRLLFNLFDGHTGDDDERAINKLVNCLFPDTVRTLLTMSGTRYEDFDDEVDGPEWRTLRRILDEKRAAT